ncbi:S-layer homology domain-containing protein [Aquibacillus sediminis]|uniref:S-layer homology domain-containing protein n=1 Tax=Aquibacillus sediminis TaxID=2574734 RepID=UPI00110A08ED|nr:S-layer homology domain-containing protein [Aquibacillus sediminis]
MGEQKKNNRKVFATTLTAAVAGAAIVPAAVSAADTNLTDVAGTEFEAEISFLASQDIIGGFPDDTFRPKEEVTRAQSAKYLANALGLEADGVEDYADVTPVNSPTFYEHIDAVSDIFGGDFDGNFNANDNLTREAAAATIVRAFGLNGGVETSFEDLQGTLKAEVETAYANGIVNGYSDTTFAPKDNVTRGELAAMIYRALEATDQISYEPAVDEVSASNNKQVELTLSGDVDLDAVEDVDNYILEDEDGEELDISVDVVESDVQVASVNSQVKVVVTIDDNEKVANNQDVYTLTVDEVVTGEEVVEEVEFFDTTIPEVTGAEVAGKDTIKVKFSEPLDVYYDEDSSSFKNQAGETVDLKDAFEVDGGDYYIESVEVLNNGTEVNVTTYADLEEGPVDISVDSSLEDYAGYNVKATTETLNVVVDEDAPEVVGYKDASPRSVTLVFDEDIDIDENDIDADEFYHTNSNNPAVDYELDGNELTLTFVDDDNDNELPQGTAYVYLPGEAIVDLWGNDIKNQTTVEVEVTVDEEAPVLEEIDASESEVELTFSEDVKADRDNFTILDEDGEETDLAGSIDVDGDVVTINATDDLVGDYTIVVDGVEDLAGNEIDKTTKDFAVADENAPNLTADATSKFYEGTDEHKLVVRYPEKMSTTGEYSIADLEKYVIVDTTDEDKAYDLSDVDGTEIKTLDDSSVEITILDEEWDGSTNYDDLELYVGRVADDSGNKTGLQSEVDVAGEDVVEFDEIYATDTNTVVAVLKDRLDEFDKDDFEFNGLNESADIEKVSTSLNSAGNTVLTFELSDDALPADLDSVQLEVVDENSVNEYGEEVDQGTHDVEDRIAPEVYDEDADSNTPNLVNETGNVSEIELTFTEAVVASNEGAAATYFTVVDADGEKLELASDFDTTNPSEGEFSVVFSESASSTVTVYVYGADHEDGDEIEIDFTSNKYFTDDSDEANEVKEFGVTVDVYQD